jgi:hypothetical protein
LQRTSVHTCFNVDEIASSPRGTCRFQPDLRRFEGGNVRTALTVAGTFVLHEVFRHIAKKISRAVGTPVAFPARDHARAWLADRGSDVRLLGWLAARDQLDDTIVTFLVVFLIQNTQNRDSKEIHLKVLDVEDMPDE